MAQGIALLFNFILIAIYGEVKIQEPNIYILYTEIAMMVLIIAYGIYFYIVSWRLFPVFRATVKVIP